MPDHSPIQGDLRVLILNYEYPPLGGGAGVATRYLISALSKMDGVRADLVTSSIAGSRIEYVSPTATIHYLDIGKEGSLHYQSIRELSVYAARAYFYVRGLLRRSSFDVTHAFFGIPCGVTALNLGLPYIVSLRGSDVPFYNKRFEKLDKLLFKRMSRLVWKRAAHVAANSIGLRDLALKSAPERKISVIPNGVDCTFFHPASKRRQAAEIDIISTGRLIERKGYAYLIEALKGLPNIRLRLVGDGNLTAELQSAAAKAAVKVEFLGPKSKDEVAKLLREADLFVLPSLNEGMSNSLLEALASGLPAVVTDVGGSGELITDGKNGYIVEKADAAGLRRAVEIYIRNRRLLTVHGSVSRQVAETMSIEKNAEQYVALYRDAKSLP